MFSFCKRWKGSCTCFLDKLFNKDWSISLVTTLEDLDSTKKVTVTPSLNATHLNNTMTSNTDGGITQKEILNYST